MRPANPFQTYSGESHSVYSVVVVERDMDCIILIRGDDAIEG